MINLQLTIYNEFLLKLTMPEGKTHKIPASISDQLIRELEALNEAEATTTIIGEKDFPERKFPIRYNPNSPKQLVSQRYEWDESEIRKFYEDPENVSRTIFCKQINVDELDDWGMFGYTPGFIYIEKKRYEGERTLADKAAGLGLSIAVDPKTGLGVMNHFDYFPKHKFNYQLIRQSEYPEVFKIMTDIFYKRRVEGSQIPDNPLLGSAK